MVIHFTIYFLYLKKKNVHLKKSLFGYQVKGARGVVVIVVENEHGDSSSNPERD